MVGVRQDDLRAEIREVIGSESFDCRRGADRHERRGLDGAVREPERAAARALARCAQLKGSGARGNHPRSSSRVRTYAAGGSASKASGSRVTG
jgi:hypothetical protein